MGMMIRNSFSIILLLCTTALVDAHTVMAAETNPLVIAMTDPTKPDYSDSSSQRKSKAAKTKTKSPLSKLSLQQTLISNRRKNAIINGKTMGIGEKIYGAKLVKINSNNVELIYNGKRFTLNLTFPSNIKEVKR
ncbi:MAG: hypothetical protein OEM38_07295 [Gammaproteobacteria bacterium]|nr:hypothetical protein [Gammaproteobacteria bacterium]